MHTRVHPAAARQPHVAYTDHVNTSWSACIVVFYGELDFSPSVEATRACYFVAAKTIFHVPSRHDTRHNADAAPVRSGLFASLRDFTHMTGLFVITPPTRLDRTRGRKKFCLA